jgi:glycosyl transferase family 2
MFDIVDAGIYLIVDGDDTYPADAARDLIETLRRDGADMVVGTRLSRFEGDSFRRFHFFGNRTPRKTTSR